MHGHRVHWGQDIRPNCAFVTLAQSSLRCETRGDGGKQSSDCMGRAPGVSPSRDRQGGKARCVVDSVPSGHDEDYTHLGTHARGSLPPRHGVAVLPPPRYPRVRPIFPLLISRRLSPPLSCQDRRLCPISHPTGRSFPPRSVVNPSHVTRLVDPPSGTYRRLRVLVAGCLWSMVCLEPLACSVPKIFQSSRPHDSRSYVRDHALRDIIVALSERPDQGPWVKLFLARHADDLPWCSDRKVYRPSASGRPWCDDIGSQHCQQIPLNHSRSVRDRYTISPKRGVPAHVAVSTSPIPWCLFETMAQVQPTPVSGRVKQRPGRG